MAIGRLQIGAYAVDIGVPAGNATIRVSRSERPDQIIAEMETNSSGQTDTIDLEAPDPTLSLEPQTFSIPYSEYNVEVSLPGYQTTTMERVQILPDTTALQDIRLNPSVDNIPPERSIPIDPNRLWGEFPAKVPEDEVKPLPESLGFVVLPEPVIPQYVIVHDGAPSNTAAPNYWIPYKDYIKNVASCEIYSTWPMSTIEANVLAINSFTLNRIYTEWYRSQGYSFTVTSSTAYDHAFSYQRNIYENISIAVDNLFQNFITRPDIRQPLLAQYCDGVQVSCPGWMTQWGSKSLGDAGYDSVRILRNYYGQDIYLMGTEYVSGVPSSYPGYHLQVGSTGAAVRTIQEQLNAISNNYPAISKQPVDGLFGPATLAAVEAFQSIFRLPASGIVDYPTWYQISRIYVAVTRMAELT